MKVNLFYQFPLPPVVDSAIPQQVNRRDKKRLGGYAAPALSYSRHMYRVNRSAIGAMRQKQIMIPRNGITLMIIKIT